MSRCILTKSYLSTNGYGAPMIVDGKSYRAHRGVWVKAYGPIPKGMVVDHTCHNKAAKRGKCKGGITCKHRACINPEHLRLVTQRENVMSGLHSIDTRSHCNQGHKFIKKNIMVRKSGKRECAECNRVRARNNYRLKIAKDTFMTTHTDKNKAVV